MSEQSGSRRYLRVPDFDRRQHPKRPRRPSWIKLYVDDLNDPDYTSLTLAVRGFFNDFCRLAADMQNRVPDDVSFIARRIGAPSHVVGKSLRTCVELDMISYFALDAIHSENNNKCAKIAPRSIPPSYSYSKSAGEDTNSTSTTTPESPERSPDDLFEHINDLDIPF